MKYPNFYETVKEANMRLRHTIVWYDGPGEKGPYFVLMITNHEGENYKIYMKRIGQKYNNVTENPPCDILHPEDASVGPAMDEFMKTCPKFGIIRKDLNSPHFRAFRPFPLGMMNLVHKNTKGKLVDCETLYLERQPNRSTQQGLTRTMIYVSPVNAAMSRPPTQINYNFDMWSEDLYDCLMGNYPSPDICLSKLTDDQYLNEAAAFHRHFAFVRGPVGMIFLAYKGDIIGLLDNKNLSAITVSREHRYTKEVVADLQLFNNIK